MNVEAFNGTAIKYRKELLMLLALGLKTSLPFVTPMRGVQHKQVLGSLESDAELRPHTGNLNVQDTTKVAKRTLEVFAGDCVAVEDPERLRNTILGLGLVGDSGAGTKHPMEAKIIASVINSISSKLNKSLFSAVRKSDGTKTTDLFNGFDTITQADITGGLITEAKGNLATVTEITESNVIDVLKSFYLNSSDELQEESSFLYLPKSIYNMYQSAYLEERGQTNLVTGEKKMSLEGSDGRCVFAPMVGKKGSNLIQLSTKRNLVVGMDQMSDLEKIEVRRGDNPFKWQFILKAVFGVEFDTIHKNFFKVLKVGS